MPHGAACRQFSVYDGYSSGDIYCRCFAITKATGLWHTVLVDRCIFEMMFKDDDQCFRIRLLKPSFALHLQPRRWRSRSSCEDPFIPKKVPIFKANVSAFHLGSLSNPIVSWFVQFRPSESNCFGHEMRIRTTSARRCLFPSLRYYLDPKYLEEFG